MLASPEEVHKAIRWIQSQEWIFVRTMEAYRRSNVVIFSKATWMWAYAQARTDYQRDLVRGLRSWSAAEFREDKMVSFGNGRQQSLRRIMQKSASSLLNRILYEDLSKHQHRRDFSFWLPESHGPEWEWAGVETDKNGKTSLVRAPPRSKKYAFRQSTGCLVLMGKTFIPLAGHHDVFPWAIAQAETCKLHAIEEARREVEKVMKWARTPAWTSAPPSWVLEFEEMKRKPPKPIRPFALSTSWYAARENRVVDYGAYVGRYRCDGATTWARSLKRFCPTPHQPYLPDLTICQKALTT